MAIPSIPGATNVSIKVVVGKGGTITHVLKVTTNIELDGTATGYDPDKVADLTAAVDAALKADPSLDSAEIEMAQAGGWAA